uniref:Uncharacterized protein n=1 Tax=Streptomyces sp. NBC_00003 TaxID=2903608 RepID=A0AAU2VGY4_9ACTN
MAETFDGAPRGVGQMWIHARRARHAQGDWADYLAARQDSQGGEV